MIEDGMVAMEEAEKLRAVSAEVVEEVGDAKEAEGEKKEDEKNEIEKKKRSSSSWKRLQKRLGRDETEKKKKKTETKNEIAMKACSAHLSNIDNE